MRIKYLLSILLFLLLCGCQKGLELHNGDLLFQQKIDNQFTSAIADATTSIDKYQFKTVTR